jgi:hypothetical protein
MPRAPRFTYPHAVHHVTLRCNNREFLFEPAWFEIFVSLLEETRRRFPLSLFTSWGAGGSCGAWRRGPGWTGRARESNGRSTALAS